MSDASDSRTPGQRPQRAWKEASDWVDESEPKLSKEELQALAHGRGRICKERSCAVCAPLRETRRLKKAQRRANAQAQAHDGGQPCSRSSCALDVCVAARNAVPASPPPVERPMKPETSESDPEQIRRREAKRHRVGLPCGSEICPNQQCIDGFVNERTRRHRARRPCRSASCDNPICVAGR